MRSWWNGHINQLDLSVSVPVKAEEEDDARGERQQINILLFTFHTSLYY